MEARAQHPLIRPPSTQPEPGATRSGHIGHPSGVLPPGWHPCTSTAIEAFRYVRHEAILKLLFVDGRMAYDYPCTPALYEAFLRASSKGRFVNETLKPYAESRGWSPRPQEWSR
jgi:KTSC domain